MTPINLNNINSNFINGELSELETKVLLRYESMPYWDSLSRAEKDNAITECTSFLKCVQATAEKYNPYLSIDTCVYTTLKRGEDIYNKQGDLEGRVQLSSKFPFFLGLDCLKDNPEYLELESLLEFLNNSFTEKFQGIALHDILAMFSLDPVESSEGDEKECLSLMAETFDFFWVFSYFCSKQGLSQSLEIWQTILNEKNNEIIPFLKRFHPAYGIFFYDVFFRGKKELNIMDMMQKIHKCYLHLKGISSGNGFVENEETLSELKASLNALETWLMDFIGQSKESIMMMSHFFSYISTSGETDTDYATSAKTKKEFQSGLKERILSFYARVSKDPTLLPKVDIKNEGKFILPFLSSGTRAIDMISIIESFYSAFFKSSFAQLEILSNQRALQKVSRVNTPPRLLTVEGTPLQIEISSSKDEVEEEGESEIYLAPTNNNNESTKKAKFSIPNPLAAKARVNALQHFSKIQEIFVVLADKKEVSSAGLSSTLYQFVIHQSLALEQIVSAHFIQGNKIYSEEEYKKSALMTWNV